MASLTEVIPRPLRAFVGSALTIGSAGVVGVPYGAIIGLPLLVLGTTLCVQGALVPIDDGVSKVRRTAAEVVLTLGAVGLLAGCMMTSVLVVDYLVALKRGQSPMPWWDQWATLVASVLALVLLTLGNLLRAKTPTSQTSLRAIYWFLHFPGCALVVRFYAAVGMTLTA
jgi:hypothetical protein